MHTRTRILCTLLLLGVQAAGAAEVTDSELTTLGKALLEAGGPWFSRETEHFVCRALSDAAAAAAADEAEFAYRQACVCLGSEPALRRGHVFVVSDRALWCKVLHGADRRKDSLAVQSRNDIFVLKDGGGISDAMRLPHEIVHFRLWQQYGDGVPVWLDEGLAGYVGWNAADAYQREKGVQLVRTLPQLAPEELMSLDELMATAEYPESEEAVQALCRQAEELIRAIAERRGDAKLGGLAKAVVAERTPWREYLRSQMGYSGEDFGRLSDLVRGRAQEGEGW